MKDAPTIHAEQVAYWNGPNSASWVTGQERMDRTLAPVADAAIAHARVQPGETVLDIGCGTGATTLALAAAVGPTGHVTGLDVSVPMLSLAKERGAGIANADFVLDDAAAHAFTPASVDLLFSRFGVMFFGDPAAAFTNLRQAMKPTGRLVFACWRAFDENPWMKLPLTAALAHVPPLPRPGPDDPGPFAFADPDKVTRILTAAGFAAPAMTPFDFKMVLAPGRGLDAATEQAVMVGPASRALADQPAAAVAAATAAIRAALAAHLDGDTVKLDAAVWLVSA